MRKVIGTLFLVFAVTAFAMTAFAQPGGGQGGRDRGPGGRGPGGFPPGGGIGFLLRNDEIKSQLGLTEEQVSKLEKIAEESRPRRVERGERSADRQGPPSREEMQKFREEFEKRADEAAAKVNQVLTPEQQAKLKVLQFQLSGGLESPFLSARSLDVLELTAEQKAQLKAISDEREAEARASFEKRSQIDWRNLSQEDREKLRAENEANGKKYAEKIKGILTPEQKEKAEKLSAGSQELREKAGIGRGPGGPGGGQEGEYRPGDNSWRPGQGTGGKGKETKPRRSFPQSE